MSSIATGCRWLLDAPRRSRGRRQPPSRPRNPTLAPCVLGRVHVPCQWSGSGGWRVVLVLPGDEAEVRVLSTLPIPFPRTHVLPARCHKAAASPASVRADLCRPQHRPQVLRPRGEPKSAEGAAGRPGKRSQPSTHGLARGSGAFAAAGDNPVTDERRLDDSGSRLTRPPTPASTAGAVSRIRCWSRQQPPGDGPAKVSDVPSSRDYQAGSYRKGS